MTEKQPLWPRLNLMRMVIEQEKDHDVPKQRWKDMFAKLEGRNSTFRQMEILIALSLTSCVAV